jgi:hypothetical protein
MGKPRRSAASGSPDRCRLATLIEMPFPASQTNPSIVDAQLRRSPLQLMDDAAVMVDQTGTSSTFKLMA